MALSVFHLFSVGIGPSSSHPVGPMRAAGMFAHRLREEGHLAQVARVKAELFGSLGASRLGHLGLTCDPLGGLVQIRCIERNAIASVKAITAGRTALRGDGSHVVSLDKVVKTMGETGRDMKAK